MCSENMLPMTGNFDFRSDFDLDFDSSDLESFASLGRGSAMVPTLRHTFKLIN